MVDVLILNYNDPATTIQLIQNISKQLSAGTEENPSQKTAHGRYARGNFVISVLFSSRLYGHCGHTLQSRLSQTDASAR